MAATNNFIPANENTQFIIIESLSEKALDILRLYFNEKVPLYTMQKEKKQELHKLTAENVPFKRVHLYSYKNTYELDKIIEYLNDNEIPLISFSQINDSFIKEINRSVKHEQNVFVDITSLVFAILDNASLMYYAEKVMIENPNLKIITHFDQAEETLKVFRLIFNKVQPIDQLIQIESQEEILEDKTIKVTDLTNDEVNKAVGEITNNLFGHKKFKDQLPNAISNFIFLNRIKEKKVFSIFLLGDSGLGKTEFASLLKNQLNPNTSLVKINFGNYSSQDALIV